MWRAEDGERRGSTEGRSVGQRQGGGVGGSKVQTRLATGLLSTAPPSFQHGQCTLLLPQYPCLPLNCSLQNRHFPFLLPFSLPFSLPSPSLPSTPPLLSHPILIFRLSLPPFAWCVPASCVAQCRRWSQGRHTRRCLKAILHVSADRRMAFAEEDSGADLAHAPS